MFLYIINFGFPLQASRDIRVDRKVALTFPLQHQSPLYWPSQYRQHEWGQNTINPFPEPQRTAGSELWPGALTITSELRAKHELQEDRRPIVIM
jgi:hypothetical protein